MLKVLVVEDDALVRLFLKKLIKKKFNYTVLEAGNGIEGLSLIHEHSPDLILLDISMPMMDGLEMLNTLRNDPDNRGIPVAVLTAFSDKELVSQLLGLGISDFILKPLDLEKTFERLQKIINENRILQKKDHNNVKPPKSSNSDERRKLLIIDRDEKTKSLFQSLFSNSFDVIEGTTGADCLKYALEYKPKYVFLSENLEIISEKLLAERLRGLEYNRDLEIYLLTRNLANLSTWQKTYDGVIKKTGDPDILEKEFKRVVLGSAAAFTNIKELLASAFRKEVFSALRQSFGVIAQVDVKEIPVQSKFLDYDFAVKEMIRDKEKGITISVILTAKKNDIEEIVRNAVSIDEPENELINRILTDIVTVTTDRIRVTLQKYDYGFTSLKLDERRKAIIPQKSAWNLTITAETKKGSVFVLGLIAEG